MGRIPELDRKLLLERAHNRCAICGRSSSSVPMEAAHQAPHSPRGPRGDASGCVPIRIDKGKLDTYDNLILLCSNHHGIADEKAWQKFWSEPRLKKVKCYHEEFFSFEANPRPLTVGDSCRLNNAALRATVGETEEAIDAYLDAVSEAMSARNLAVVIAASLSLAVLMAFKAKETGRVFGINCCLRAKKLSDYLPEKEQRAYYLIAEWNQAYLEFHEPDVTGSSGPDTSAIAARLGAFYSPGPPLQGIDLSLPVIIAGESARCVLGPGAGRYEPLQTLSFPQRYLGTYLFHSHATPGEQSPKVKAANFWLDHENELRRAPDGSLHLALAHILKGSKRQARKELRRYETPPAEFTLKLDLAEANAGTIAMKEWVDRANSDGSIRPMRDSGLVFGAVSERYKVGDEEHGFDAELVKIGCTPWFERLRKEFPLSEDLKKALQ